MAKNTEGGRTMRRVFLPILAIFLVFSLSVVLGDRVLAPSKAEAEETIDHNLLDKMAIAVVINYYFNALFSRQYDKVKACLYPGGPTDATLDEAWKRTHDQYREVLEELKKLNCQETTWRVKVTEVAISGNIAVAKLGDFTASTTCRSGPLHETFSGLADEEIVLCKYNGEWRIWWAFPYLKFFK
jgi:hypothetical protein